MRFACVLLICSCASLQPAVESPDGSSTDRFAELCPPSSHSRSDNGAGTECSPELDRAALDAERRCANEHNNEAYVAIVRATLEAEGLSPERRAEVDPTAEGAIMLSGGEGSTVSRQLTTDSEGNLVLVEHRPEVTTRTYASCECDQRGTPPISYPGAGVMLEPGETISRTVTITYPRLDIETRKVGRCAPMP